MNTKIKTQMISSLKSQRGFSIVEVLVAIGLMSGLGLLMMQTMQDSNNISSLSEAKFEELELSRQLQTALVYKPACEKNLQGKVMDTMTINDIAKFVDANGNNVFEKGQVVGNRSLKITDIQFGISQQSFDDFTAFKSHWPAGVTSYLLDIYVTLKTEKLKTKLGGQNMSRTFPVKVKVDATSMIQECFSTNDAANAMAMSNFCTQLGGVFNTATNACDFNQSCTATGPQQLIPAKCVDEKVAAALADVTKSLAELAVARAPASTPTPVVVVPTATPVVVAAIDRYALPFSRLNPGPGCKGQACSASDYGPCEGLGCRTNGGSCSGVACQAGVVTGTVAYDGVNYYTPSQPGPGCKGQGCHASDYGPCDGLGCSTNGGSCTGVSCSTGVNQ